MIDIVRTERLRVFFHGRPGERLFVNEDVLEVFRRAAFNVFAHNRDDHSRNIAFMMGPNGDWSVAPAHDLTFSEGPGGEHTMTIAGEGKAPGRGDLERMAADAGIKRRAAADILDQVENAIEDFEAIASEVGVTKAIRREIAKRFPV